MYNNNNKIKILLIIPAYNEQANIYNTYKSICDFNETANMKYDAIVINDGSTDDTENICKKYNIPHLTLRNNLGIGNAVQTGYKYAFKHKYDIAIQYDGDGQHDVNYVDSIIRPLIDKEANVVIGSRFLNETSSKFKSSKARRIGINLISWLINILVKVKIYDTTSGFRAVDKEIIEKFSISYYPEYPEPVSIPALVKCGYKIKEIPVSMNERKGGASSIRAWKSIYFMLNVFLLIFVEVLGGYKNEH